MQDGFIIFIFNHIIEFSNKWLNLVELIKWIFRKIFNATTDDKKIKMSNIAIDVFIIIKWLFLLLMLKLNIDNCCIQIIIGYLLIMNIITYFYHHLWSKKAIIGITKRISHIRKKFITLMSAIFYNIVSFAYFYQANIVITDKNKNIDSFKFILHSISSTFTGGSDYLTDIGTVSGGLQISQMIVSFIFIGILLGKSDSFEEPTQNNP